MDIVDNNAVPKEPAHALTFRVPVSGWSELEAENKSAAELLLYRSNLLGSDLTVTNFGGGNTSAKLIGLDPLTSEPTPVLWVKGSGGDLGSMKMEGFATLYLARLLALERRYRSGECEDDMVGYENTIELIADAAGYLNDRLVRGQAFGGWRIRPWSPERRASVAAELMPKLRAVMSREGTKVGHFSDDSETLEFVCSCQFTQLSAIGTSCPDHFLRTKIKPLVLDGERVDSTIYLESEINAYRFECAAYYQRCVKPHDPAMRDPNPVVVLVPGLGRITFAADKTTARLAGEFYGNAINVMRGAEAIGRYVGLEEREAFQIE